MSKLGLAVTALLLAASALYGQAAHAAHAAARVAPRSGAMWLPAPNTRWQYQLTGNSAYPGTGGVNTGICQPTYKGGACVKPQVFDIDLYADANVVGNNSTENTAAVKAIHAEGAKAICYVDAGGIEKVRPDYQQYVDWANAHGGMSVLFGNPYPGFPDDSYANINNDTGQRDFILQVQEARVQKCVQAGFDGVEFDVVNAYEDGQSTTGIDISAATQLTFDKALAALAHKYNLSVALKNDLTQIPDLVSSFDYATNEQCFQYSECLSSDNGGYGYDQFTGAGKAVFTVEYSTSPSTFCPKANADNFNSIKKGGDHTLKDTPWTPCR